MDPAEFFHAPSEVDAPVHNLTEPGYAPCVSRMPFDDPILLQSFVDLYGDRDGTQTADGVLQGACVDELVLCDISSLRGVMATLGVCGLLMCSVFPLAWVAWVTYQLPADGVF